MFHLNIPSPCSEPLAGMTPTERGRYCSACQREILDFTGFTDVQLYRYFMAAAEKGEIPCGFFRPDQVGRTYAPPARPGAYARTWRALGLLMAGVLPAATVGAQNLHPEKQAVQRTIEGIVYDASSGQVLPGARVMVQGRQLYVVESDESGRFKLDIDAPLPEGSLVLSAKALGYNLLQQPVNAFEPTQMIHLKAYTHGDLYDNYIPVLTGQILVVEPEEPTLWQRIKAFFRRGKERRRPLV